ncbi:MAG: helix-hairpin-helix domain-containing protein, partial [Pseudoclavibacter sp.]
GGARRLAGSSALGRDASGAGIRHATDGDDREPEERLPLVLIDATGDSEKGDESDERERDRVGDDPDSPLTAAELDALFERPARPRVRMGVGAGIVLALVALAIGLVVAALQPSPATTLEGDAAGLADGAEAEAAGDGGIDGLGEAVQDAGGGGADAGGGAADPGAGGGASASAEYGANGGAGTAGSSGTGQAAGASILLVHVVGAVGAPGVVTLPAGSRVTDAIDAAGGFTSEADQSAVNLARALIDGEQIWVPRIGESPEDAPPGVGAAGSGAGSAASAATGGGSADGTSAAAGAGGGLVNLNTATQPELETLPRIGPALAQRIIDYRDQNGGFASVDELTNVSGIGDATFEALAPLVTV